MYFATNPPLDTLPAQIAQELDDLRDARPAAPMHLYALVDCAFDETFLSARYRRTLPTQSLYAKTALQALGAAAPHLLTAPDGAAERLAWLRLLFGACEGKPMLSVVASVLGADELARHMRAYLVAMTPDTVGWPVRWGDTRVLPALLEALPQAQRSHFLAPVARWWSPGRDGGLLSWDGAAALPAPAGFGKLPLSDEVFAHLVDTAEADAVLARLYDSQPDLFRADSPAQCHARVERHLRLASANGIHAAPAREQFSALALLLADDFTQQAAMAELLRRTRQGADYNDEIGALPDEFWQAAER